MNFLTHLIAAIAGGLIASHGLAPTQSRADPSAIGAVDGMVIERQMSDLVTIGVVFGICHLLPDLEVLLRRRGKISQLTQRSGMTHSIPFMLVIPCLVGTVGLGNGLESFIRTAIAGVAGYAAHIVMDLLAPYPVAVLWPLKRRFSLGILYSRDYGMMLGIALPGAFFQSPPLALTVLALFMGLYVSLRVGYLIYAKRRWPFFKAHLGREKVELVTFIPDSMQPWVWKVAIKTDDSFHAWNLDLMTGVAGDRTKLDRRESGLARRARALPLVREIDAFTPWFALTEHPPEAGQTRVRITGKDVRYHFYGRENPLRLELFYEGNNLVESRML